LRGRSRFGLRLAAGISLESVRLYWSAALLIVLLGATSIGALVPVRSFASRHSASESLLQLPAIPADPVAPPFTQSSIDPGVLQARAVGELTLLLVILGWAALAIAGISMLTQFFAQAAERGPEIGVRRSVGASRRDLLLSLLGEGGIMYLVVLAVGLPLAALVFRISTSSWPGIVSREELAPFAALLALAIILGLGALAPLRFAGARHMRSQADGQVMLGIPTFQLGMSLAILLGSASLLQGASDQQGAATASTAAPAQVFSLTTTASDPKARSDELVSLLAGLRGTPGVERVSVASPGTLLGLGRVDHGTTDCGRCYEGMILIRWKLITARHNMVSEDTFAVQSLRLLEGRAFTATDGWAADRVAIVNRHLANTAFEGGNAVGRDLYLGDDWPKRPYRVVGIVEDTRSSVLGGSLMPSDTIYLHALQHPPHTVELAIQGTDAEALRAGVPAAASPRGTSTDVLAASAVPIEWFGRRFLLIGVVVLSAAIAGTFGTMRMWVRSMAAELAARRAVGASRPRIVAWVLWHTLGTGFKGVAAGLFLYFAVLRVSLVNLVGHTPAWDPVLIGGLAGTLVAAAVLGALLPTMTLLRKPVAQLFS
jgi:putative ABC transport system permease protein